MGATDLIASGDWTVPREGGHTCPFLSNKQMMVRISMPADLLSSYSKARFFHRSSSLFWALASTRDFRGLKSTRRLGERAL